MPIWLPIYNALVHSSNFAISAIQDCGLASIDQPPYSLDLAPFDFNLFNHLKKDMRGMHFDDANNVQQFVDDWFAKKDDAFFMKAFDELLLRWRKLIDVDDGYIEK